MVGRLACIACLAGVVLAEYGDIEFEPEVDVAELSAKGAVFIQKKEASGKARGSVFAKEKEEQQKAASAHKAAAGREEVAGRRAGGRRYLPGVHAEAVEEAFHTVVAEGGDLTEVLKRYGQAGMEKKTYGTCAWGGCYFWRGPTDCLGGICLCQDGYGTKDGEKCVARYSMPLTDHFQYKDTGGTCAWFGCLGWRGPTDCKDGRCLCKDGYVADEGICVRPSDFDPAKDVVYTMLLAGVREPDELPCPGDTFESGTMNNAVLRMAQGEEHFNVSLCRTAGQVYHASPLPMVKKSDLNDAPSENGYQGKDNALHHLYSVMTNRQWRTHMVKIMATEFVYAIVMPDLGEAAKRLGNIFHTLSDSFSASHVVRFPSHAAKATAQTCGQRRVMLAMSMDVMNFIRHPYADMLKDDIYYKCSVFYEAAAIRLWAEARKKGVGTLAEANSWVDRILQEVFCNALPLAGDDLDKPAGGASTTFSVDSDQPALPKGTSSEADFNRIIAGWASGLAAARAKESDSEKAAYPRGLVVPPRSEDACAFEHLAHVDKQHFEAARDNKLPPNYLQPHF